MLRPLISVMSWCAIGVGASDARWLCLLRRGADNSAVVESQTALRNDMEHILIEMEGNMERNMDRKMEMDENMERNIDRKTDDMMHDINRMRADVT